MLATRQTIKNNLQFILNKAGDYIKAPANVNIGLQVMLDELQYKKSISL